MSSGWQLSQVWNVENILDAFDFATCSFLIKLIAFTESGLVSFYVSNSLTVKASKSCSFLMELDIRWQVKSCRENMSS